MGGRYLREFSISGGFFCLAGLVGGFPNLKFSFCFKDIFFLLKHLGDLWSTEKKLRLDPRYYCNFSENTKLILEVC